MASESATYAARASAAQHRPTFHLRKDAPLYVGIESFEDTAVSGFTDILATNGEWPKNLCAATRVRAVDLRSAQRACAALRKNALTHASPLLLDVEVSLDPDPTVARARAEHTGSEPGERPCLRYVGTPVGLATLIADIHILGIADGVMLIPLVKEPARDQHLCGMLTLLGVFVCEE
jgi:hypothetical protein